MVALGGLSNILQISNIKFETCIKICDKVTIVKNAKKNENVLERGL
jgi:hypothetical protein